MLVLNGRESWSVMLKLDHRLRVFEYTVLRKVLGCKRGDVAGEWRKLYGEELHTPHQTLLV